MSVTTQARDARIGRLERSALTGVLVREVVNYSSYWKSSTFSSTVEPTIYLLAFGFGFGSLVSTIGGLDYVAFVGTGTVATAVLFSSAFPGMFGTFVKYQFQRTYDAILAGSGWACFGISIAGFSKSFENFNYVVSAVLTPLFLLAGSFFPLDNFPKWARVLAQLNPLHHLVQLVRDAVIYGWDGWIDFARLGALLLFGLVIWRIAIHAMTGKLID